MASIILKSVGAAGINRYDDVKVIQSLLLQNGVDPGPVDGRCGPRTVHAILNFQSHFLSHPDGRVDPNGMTWRHLTNGTQSHGLGAPVPHQTQPPVIPVPTSADGQSLTKLIPRPARESINHGLTAVTNTFMLQHLGNPREFYTQDCQPVTNAKLKRNMVTQHVGPFRVTGLRPAVNSLQNALAQVQKDQPAVYSALGTAGMLCCRLQRKSIHAISNHSWGTAIDLKLNGILDDPGNNTVQLGLALIASIMNQHGWYWGAAFGREDAMHFEGSYSAILSWENQLS